MGGMTVYRGDCMDTWLDQYVEVYHVPLILRGIWNLGISIGITVFLFVAFTPPTAHV